MVNPNSTVPTPGAWLISLSLQDAYFYIARIPSQRWYLRFMVGHEHYWYCVFPLCLSATPRAFPKVLEIAAKHQRKKGTSVYLHLDGWLVQGKSPHQVSKAAQYTCSPVQNLGVHWCTASTLAFLPWDGFQNLSSLISVVVG